MHRVYLTLFAGSFLAFILFPVFFQLKAEKTMHSPFNVPLKKIWLVFVALIVLSVYGAFTGDYPSFKEIVEELTTRKSYLMFTHFEEVYIWLAQAVEGNYDLWRLGIALVSYTSLFFCLKLTGSLNYRTLFLFSTWELWGAVMGRQQCSTYILTLGLILIWTRRKYLFGFLFIILSLFLHKGGLIGLAILPFVFIKINKPNLIVLMIVFVIVASGEQILLDYLKEDDDFVGKNYLQIEDFDRTIFNLIDWWARVISIYIFGFWVLLRFRKYKHIKWCNYMARFLLGAMYVSSLIFFIPIEQRTPFERSLRLWYIPMFLLGVRAMNTRWDRNKLIIILSWFNMVMVILYMIMSFRGQIDKYYNDLF